MKAAVAQKDLSLGFTLDSLYPYHVENEKGSQTSHISESKHIS